MKMHEVTIWRGLIALAWVFSFSIRTVVAQGSLTPPGPPGPLMKTLDQIEPRTPISSAPFTITRSGSYYLTTNVSVGAGNAITINTNGVTLDLRGFTISSTNPSATGYGILVNGSWRNITILNGFIEGGVVKSGGVYSGPGFGGGIFCQTDIIDPENIRIDGISVMGCRLSGIDIGIGNSTVVESCTVRTAGGDGIFAATVRGSGASDCGGFAIYGNQVSDCWGDGTYGVSGNAVQNCVGTCTSGAGIFGRVVQNCVGYTYANGTGVSGYLCDNCHGFSQSGDGVYSQSVAMNSWGESGGAGRGLYAERSAQNCYGLNDGSGPGLVTAIANNCSGKSATGVGLTFSKIGAMCFGERTTPPASNQVLGGGAAGPMNLP